MKHVTDNLNPQSRLPAGRHSLVVSLRCLAAIGICCGSTLVRAADIPLGNGSVARFADVRSGVEALTRRDDYLLQMSPFDRQVRPKAERPLTLDELSTFIASHVRPWTDEEMRRVTPLVESIAKKMQPWQLKLPEVVLLVKTSGVEEGGAAYCRGNAIVLSQQMIDGRSDTLARILPHEFFHILSSHNRPLREVLYQSIGFLPCNEVPLPEGLRDRKITNPDAPVNDHYIAVKQDGREIELMPILFSKHPKYDPATGGTLFNYLDFKLMQLVNDNGTRKPALVNGQPVLYEAAQVPGFGEQVGKNTNYLWHPEEILADNFVLLLDGRTNLPTQRVVERLGQLLKEGGTRN